VFRAPLPSRGQVTEDEIRLLVAEGEEQGVIDEAERRMVNRVLTLGDRTVAAVMTPRTRIVWLDAAAPWRRTSRSCARPRTRAIRSCAAATRTCSA
jgi:putative hemolysin